MTEKMRNILQHSQGSTSKSSRLQPPLHHHRPAPGTHTHSALVHENDEQYLTLVPSALQPAPFRSHTLFVDPQHTLTCSKRGILMSLVNSRRTGRIRTHGAARPGRSRSSKPRDTVQRRGRFPVHATENKTTPVFPARPGFLIVKHTLTDSESQAREIGPLTLRMEYPAPRGLISHF